MVVVMRLKGMLLGVEVKEGESGNVWRGCETMTLVKSRSNVEVGVGLTMGVNVVVGVELE